MAEDDIRGQLIRMEGKQDLANERLMNMQGEIVDIKRVQHSHANDIQLLKAKDNIRDGKMQGISSSTKVLGWLISAALGAGGVGTLFEILK